MRTTVISICEQTHPRCRGYACDDHIDKYCYSVILSPELESKVIGEVDRIKEKANEALERAVDQWFNNNPTETECCYEGDEFVGLVWVEMSAIVETQDPAPHYDTTSSMILEILKEVF